VEANVSEKNTASIIKDKVPIMVIGGFYVGLKEGKVKRVDLSLTGSPLQPLRQ
jgi:hypothetical protein